MDTRIKKDNFIEKMERQAIFWGWVKISIGIMIIAFILLVIF